ncbi:MAG: hypothetical protein R2795_19755 [Saprospiraceae bacterium]
MLSGHFAPALLAHEKQLPKGTLLYFLIASQLQDLLWLVFYFIASISLRTWFGIPEFAIPINTTIPVLMLTYWGMIFYLNHLGTG